MRELLLKTLDTIDELGRKLSYQYFIVIDEMDVGPFSCESYGLKISQWGGENCCTVPHITTSIARIDELSRLVMAGNVTPATLKDVVADWL